MTSTLMQSTASGPALVFDPVGARAPRFEPTMVLPPVPAAHAAPADHGPEAHLAAPRPARAAAGVYRRRRLVVLALAIGMVLGVMSFGRQAGANRTAEAEAAAAVTVVVQPGDTLWAIARTLAPGADPRPLADALADLAGGSALQPGQRIVVPGDLLD